MTSLTFIRNVYRNTALGPFSRPDERDRRAGTPQLDVDLAGQAAADRASERNVDGGSDAVAVFGGTLLTGRQGHEAGAYQACWC